ncbi:MAG: ATP-dependent RNA helicase HrpA [Enterobacteriaceae bacterium]
MQLQDLMLRDQHSLRRRARQAMDLQAQQHFDNDLALARARVTARQLNVPEITYPAELPVSQKRDDLLKIIKQNQVVIVAGETGSGKTTQLPKICLELGRGIKGVIGHTQPRRLAARSVATRIAEELKSELGACVGYKVRFNERSSENSLIKLMTDGILLAEIQQDRLLLQYDTLIIDEAHERSLNIDFLLGYLKQLLPRRPDLKVIITSATIDPLRFSRHFSDAPIIEVSGRTYPVEIRYRPWNEEETEQGEWLDNLYGALGELYREGHGDILIFLSGEREIRDVADALRRQDLPHTEIVPLFARLSNSEQNRIFRPHTGRRIVLATNVAETSLTVPGIHYVIDAGTARISRYSYRTKVQRLPIEPISQASAGQRAGRCGRIAKGICIRLYSEQDFLSRPSFTEPEILRTNLASVILQMTSLGLGNIAAFPFVEAPDQRNIQDGIRLLEELGALQHDQRDQHKQHKQPQLTPLGRQLAQLPVDPRLGRMVLEARDHGCVREVMIITAALSIQDPRERPLEKQQASDEKHRRFMDKESDFISLVRLWDYLQEQQKNLSGSQFRKLCVSEYLNYLRVREWQDLYSQLRQTVKELGLPVNTQAADYRSLHLALLSGLLSHIGQKENEKNEFLGARNVRFALYPGSALFSKPPKWVMVAELVETSRLWGRLGARIDVEWIEPLALHLVKRHYSEPHWSKSRGAVLASERVTLYGLPIVIGRKVNYSAIDADLCHELFIRHALVEGDWQTRHAFFRHNQQLLAQAEELEHKSRRRDLVLDDEALFAFYQARIPQEVISVRHFDKWWNRVRKQQPDLLNLTEEQAISDRAQQIRTTDYPTHWQQGNITLPLHYQFEPGQTQDGVTVQILLPILNQVEAQGFDWQIPGLRRELVIALLKSLPKSLRRNFVPVPDYADAFLARVPKPQGDLLDALARELTKMTGVTVSREQWQWQLLPAHLQLTFQVLDEQGKTVAQGSDLTTLKQQLKGEMQQSLQQVAQQQPEEQRMTTWDVGTLPHYYQQQHGNYGIKAWPALVDEKQSVVLRLFDSEWEQQQAMWQGIRRLLLLAIPSPIKYLHEKLPNRAKLGLYFNPYGQVLQLIDDCIACGVDALMQQTGLVWDRDAFLQLQERVRGEINPCVVQIASQVEQILTLAWSLNKRLKGRVDLTLALGLADISNQLSRLIYPGFVTQSGQPHLADIMRYLQGIERRMEKIASDPHRDRAHMVKVQEMEQAYQQWRDQLTPEQRHSPQAQEIRWMLEELRISYFAQQLGTPYPVSEKRIRQAMVAVKQ